MKTFLLKALNVEPEESGQAMYLLGQGFWMGIVLASFDVGAVTLFLLKFDETTDLPRALLMAGVIGIVVTYLFSFFQTRVSFKALSMVWLILMVGLTLGAWYGTENITDEQLLSNVYFGVFTLALPFTFLALLIFWGSFNRLFNLRQAKRIIGGIDTGQLIASIIALFGIGLLLESLPRTEDLFLISGFAGLALFINFFLMSTKYKLEVQSAEGTSNLQRMSIPKMMKNKYIFLLGMFVIVATVAAFLVDYSFLNAIAAQFPTEKKPRGVYCIFWSHGGNL